ncbi:MAG TPA: TIGR02996 domain-containing protein, partial [Gemmataceae bacterium]|nr:TIGR02996 domain-containing protein [Gemmataceae bacterium]
MTDLDALFRAILEHPDDDTPRLIYADALEDVGESRRAAFIRAQVELARLPEYDPFWVKCKYHDRELMFGTTEWVVRLPELPDGLQWAREPFRRGFPAAIQAQNGSAFVTHADELFALAPVERLELEMVQVREALPLSRCRWLSRLTRLSLPAGLGQAVARRLLNSPHFERLTDLDIGAGFTNVTTANVVVGSQAFRRLKGLSYRDEQRGGAMVTELTRLANPPRLKRLDLAGNRITAERLARLVAAPALEA